MWSGAEQRPLPRRKLLSVRQRQALFRKPLEASFSLAVNDPFYSGAQGRIGVDMATLNSKVGGVMR
jgi:hypothetical protein